jgi:hypothetical protein
MMPGEFSPLEEALLVVTQCPCASHEEKLFTAIALSERLFTGGLTHRVAGSEPSTHDFALFSIGDHYCIGVFTSEAALHRRYPGAPMRTVSGRWAIQMLDELPDVSSLLCVSEDAAWEIRAPMSWVPGA